MVDLIYFVLCAFGLTQILVYGKIFDGVRPEKYRFRGLAEVFHCPMCLGFWVGLFLFSINGWTELFTFDYHPINALICGCISSGTSYVLSMLFGDYGINIHTEE